MVESRQTGNRDVAFDENVGDTSACVQKLPIDSIDMNTWGSRIV